MLYELREYELRLATASRYVDSFKLVAVPMLKASGFTIVDVWLTEIGEAGRLVWLLRWDDLNQRTMAFDSFHAQPGYAGFVAENGERVIAVKNRIMRSVTV